MRSEYKQGIWIICPEGRIDTGTVDGLSEEIEALIREKMPSKIILDAGAVDYISSAGLRLILNLKKRFNLIVSRVSPEVYSILETTGFTEILTVRKKLKSISIEGCPVVAKGASGIIYRLDPETIVKVYPEGTSLAELDREHEVSRKALIYGIPTAISYDMVMAGDAPASVFEMLEAKCFSDLIREDEANYGICVKLFSEVLKGIHAIESADGEFPSYREAALEWVDRIAHLISEEDALRLKALIESIPETNRLIHGDFHLGNIMYRNGEALLIDLETLGCGDELFEFGNMYVPLCAFNEADPEDTMRFFGLPADIARRFFEDVFRSCHEGMSGAELERTLRRVRILGYLSALKKVVHFSNRERAERLTAYWLPILSALLEEEHNDI